MSRRTAAQVGGLSFGADHHAGVRHPDPRPAAHTADDVRRPRVHTRRAP